MDDKSNEITAMPLLMEVLDLKEAIVTADALNTQKTIIEKAQEVGADYLFPVKGNQEALLEEIASAFDEFDKEQNKARKQWERAIAKSKEHRDEQRLQRLLKGGPDMCGGTFWESTEKGHGRIETRNCTTLSAKDLPSQPEWKGLLTIARISRERKEGEKVQRETSLKRGVATKQAAAMANPS